MADSQTQVSSPGQKVIKKFHLKMECYFNNNRDTVMKIMKEEDPCGSERRRKKTLKRRIYRNKVQTVLKLGIAIAIIIIL